MCVFFIFKWSYHKWQFLMTIVISIFLLLNDNIINDSVR